MNPIKLHLPHTPVTVPSSTGWGVDTAIVSPLASSRFAVTPDGRVFSLRGRWKRRGVGFPDRRTRWVLSPRELSPFKRGGNHHGPNGHYPSVSYRDPSTGTSAKVYVHDLVASAFHGEKEPGMEVDHVNGIPWDNRPANLRYLPMPDNRRLAGKWKANKSRNANARA